MMILEGTHPVVQLALKACGGDSRGVRHLCLPPEPGRCKVTWSSKIGHVTLHHRCKWRPGHTGQHTCEYCGDTKP